jgi:hypothetical protein
MPALRRATKMFSRYLFEICSFPDISFIDTGLFSLCANDTARCVKALKAYLPFVETFINSLLNRRPVYITYLVILYQPEFLLSMFYVITWYRRKTPKTIPDPWYMAFLLALRRLSDGLARGRLYYTGRQSKKNAIYHG